MLQQSFPHIVCQSLKKHSPPQCKSVPWLGVPWYTEIVLTSLLSYTACMVTNLIQPKDIFTTMHMNLPWQTFQLCPHLLQILPKSWDSLTVLDYSVTQNLQYQSWEANIHSKKEPVTKRNSLISDNLWVALAWILAIHRTRHWYPTVLQLWCDNILDIREFSGSVVSNPCSTGSRVFSRDRKFECCWLVQTDQFRQTAALGITVTVNCCHLYPIGLACVEATDTDAGLSGLKCSY